MESITSFLAVVYLFLLSFAGANPFRRQNPTCPQGLTPQQVQCTGDGPSFADFNTAMQNLALSHKDYEQWDSAVQPNFVYTYSGVQVSAHVRDPSCSYQVKYQDLVSYFYQVAQSCMNGSGIKYIDCWVIIGYAGSCSPDSTQVYVQVTKA